MHRHQFAFIAGLHRSGTSLLFQCLREHPQLSGFRDTGVPEDEGQHLQSVYRPASRLGGPGRFAFSRAAHLTEESPLASAENRDQLFSQWRPYWDLSRPWLLEKTPQNLLQTRFLQAMFPSARFIIMLRNPVAVSFATQRWSRTSLYSLLAHWLRAHEVFEGDRSRLEHVLVLHYEDFVTSPERTLDEVYRFLGVQSHFPSLQVRTDVNRKYFCRWENLQCGCVSRYYTEEMVQRFDSRVKHFGYSLREAGAASAEKGSTEEMPEALDDVGCRWGGVNRAVSRVYRGAAWWRYGLCRGYKNLKRPLRKLTHTNRKRRAAVHGQQTVSRVEIVDG